MIRRHIKFFTAHIIRDQNILTLIPIVRPIHGFYMKQSFIIKSILVDNQFGPMFGVITTENLELNAISKGVHMSDIDQHVIPVKERGCYIFNMLPFNSIE